MRLAIRPNSTQIRATDNLASILAKAFRDEEMERLDALFPTYRWKQNKGYPTAAHKQAIAEVGLSPYHRKTFRWQQDWMLF